MLRYNVQHPMTNTSVIENHKRALKYGIFKSALEEWYYSKKVNHTSYEKTEMRRYSVWMSE